MRARIFPGVAGLLVGILAAGSWHLGAQTAPVGEWTYWGGDRAFTRYSGLDQISADNVSQLRVAWRRPGVDPSVKQAFPDLRVSGNFRSTPLMIGGVLYAPNAIGLVRAMDPATGETRWEQKPFANTIEEVSRPSPRGVDYWKSGTEERLILVRGEYLYALNLKTGDYIRDFGDQGRVSLHWDHDLAALFSWTAGPIIANDVIIVAGATSGAGDGGVKKEAAPEDIRGFDVRTGKLLWVFHVVPRPGEFGADMQVELINDGPVTIVIDSRVRE